MFVFKAIGSGTTLLLGAGREPPQLGFGRLPVSGGPEPVRFKRRVKQRAVPDTPEALFGELPRTRGGHGALWSHQADILRDYVANRGKSDVALELPTGSGKTLVGLLISEWRRRFFGHRSVYACPTKQLAHQVWEAAQAQGVPAALFIGRSRDFDERDLGRYEAAELVAITVYSHVFNSNPVFGGAQSLLFDDAHAAEDYVADAWALKVPANTHQFRGLLDVLGDDLDPHLVARLTDDQGEDTEVRMLPVATVARHTEAFDKVLIALDGPAKFRFEMIRQQLRSCLFYVSSQGWYIRPMIPPTFDHTPFTSPVQRIYLSATLGEGGELERSFGRAPITRVRAPENWERSGSGRRFFVFPGLAETDEDIFGPEAAADGTAEGDGQGEDEAAVEPSGEDVQEKGGLVGQLVRLRAKSVLLTPDEATAKKTAAAIGVPTTEQYRPGASAEGLRPFIGASQGMLLAPSRYDGMDLPDESCNIILMRGLPESMHLQDRFLFSRLGASNIAMERVRTRVMQGAGRCTRGPKDFALVIVVGRELQRFLSRVDVRAGMPPELQAEIAFGRENSEVPAADLVALARSALDRDDVWQEDAEPDLTERRSEATREVPDYVTRLDASVWREIDAWQAAWQQDWDRASREAVEVLNRLTGKELRSYQALWAYLGSAWASLAVGSPAAAERSRELLRRAHEAASRTTWLREIEGPGGEARVLDVLDAEGVNGVITAFSRPPWKSTAKFNQLTNNMVRDLARQGATGYEQALVTLGELLGARSFKPTGDGRTDAAWMWPSSWLTLEAKSEQKSDGGISQKYIRQANTQLDHLAADEGLDEPAPGSITVVVSPRSVVVDDGVKIARDHLYLASPQSVQTIAQRAVRAWTAIRGAAPNGVEGEALRAVVQDALAAHRILPSQVFDDLSTDRIRR
ncbi:DEAD/DEAH box helicase [Streptomyces sp. NPDC085524]|uniref:DEAD/DEAH box helicase n=1 Tax=Streptomyces sp. NPDC085524 TaxID=3365728 RepID=UPI0037D6CD44